ncbi:MAG: hypothetical protein KDB00_14675 [Planctomycetales bacterium]|nr:hypothetical protein [Planctomycetales bacterium]
MSEIANQLLATFETLPSEEQHELIVALLRRGGELPDSFIADDQFVILADELFQTLDAEESNDNETESR